LDVVAAPAARVTAPLEINGKVKGEGPVIEYVIKCIKEYRAIYKFNPPCSNVKCKIRKRKV
jgi:hypothetical protein